MSLPLTTPVRVLELDRSTMTSGPRKSDAYARIYAVVQRVPRGRVVTYGQVALLAGLDGHARQVGYALHATPPGEDVPWHRVINAQGRVSQRAEDGFEHIQQQLLEAEGVVFCKGRVSLEEFRWEPRTPRRIAANRRT